LHDLITKFAKQWLFLTFIFLQCDCLVNKALKSDWLFCFTVPFSFAEKKTRFRPKDSAIRELIALLRANHIARITSDFKMDLIKILINN